MDSRNANARRTGRLAIAAALAAILVVLAVPSAAPAAPQPELIDQTPLGSDAVRYRYRHGPVAITPGQNLILLDAITSGKPDYDGYAIRIKPNLIRADGTVPNVDELHLHHAVWLNTSRRDATMGGAERFFATGEEKTTGQFPNGFGYFVDKDDRWVLNHMIHNLTAAQETVWITYDIDYVPEDSARGERLKAAKPIWMDVQNGSAYPVFNSYRRSGGSDGKFTYPREARNPYGNGRRKNEWVSDRKGTLIGSAGHVHPGGLWTDLDLVRNGETRRLFRSEAKYFDPRGPVSWDMSMTVTDPDWRVEIRPGDKLKVNTTYESERASWYEAMGIHVAWLAEGADGPNPFKRRIDTRTNRVTHGHLPENENYGGESFGAADPRALQDGSTVDKRVGIIGFQYWPGGAGLSEPFGLPPTIKPGERLTFEGPDSASTLMHSVTACKPPCNKSTGISYPLANGSPDFDSANLGFGPPGLTAAANKSSWKTPPDLKPGTYSYFCRIHPFMRGAFRVKD